MNTVNPEPLSRKAICCYPRGCGTLTRGYFLAGVDVAQAPGFSGTVVAFGDSTTDGHGSTTDGNGRWPDVLA